MGRTPSSSMARYSPQFATRLRARTSPSVSARAGVLVQQSGIEDPRSGVFVDGLDVIGRSEAQAFVGLRHQVADVDLHRRRSGDRLRDSVHQNVGNQAGEERSGADGDEVGAGDGLQRLRQRLNIGAGSSADCTMRSLLAVMLVSPRTREPSSISASSSHVGSGRGINVSACGENFRREPHGLGEVAGHCRQSAQGRGCRSCVLRARTFRESDSGTGATSALVLGERDDAVANVARRQNAEFLPKRPLEPPSSVTVTTAVSSSITADGPRACASGREGACGRSA